MLLLLSRNFFVNQSEWSSKYLLPRCIFCIISMSYRQKIRAAIRAHFYVSFFERFLIFICAPRDAALLISKIGLSGKFLQWFLQFWCLNWFGLLPIYNAVWCAIFTLENITVDSWASSISSILREEMIHIRT